jgi:hypothetical protein
MAYKYVECLILFLITAWLFSSVDFHEKCIFVKDVRVRSKLINQRYNIPPNLPKQSPLNNVGIGLDNGRIYWTTWKCKLVLYAIHRNQLVLDYLAPIIDRNTAIGLLLLVAKFVFVSTCQCHFLHLKFTIYVKVSAFSSSDLMDNSDVYSTWSCR